MERRTTACERAAQQVERLLHDRGIDSLQKPFTEYFRHAAAEAHETFPIWKLYHTLRKRYFQKAIVNASWRDYEAGPPQEGWVWDTDIVDVEGERNIVAAWIPRCLHHRAEPKDRHLFDVPQSERIRSEKLAILLLHYEAMPHSQHIFDESGEDQDAICWHAANLWLTQKRVKREREWGIPPDFPLEKWAKEIEADLDVQEAVNEAINGTTPPSVSSATDGKSKLERRHRLLLIYTSGAAMEQFDDLEGILSDGNTTADEKLREINRRLPIPPSTSAQQLAHALGVTKTAVLKTEWWHQNRRGERQSTSGRREEMLKERGRRWDPQRPPDYVES
jgi:hypothetical protein